MVWLEAGKQDFLGVAASEEYDRGGNPDFLYNTIITEETNVEGRGYSGIVFGLHNDIVASHLQCLPVEEKNSAGCPRSASGN